MVTLQTPVQVVRTERGGEIQVCTVGSRTFGGWVQLVVVVVP